MSRTSANSASAVSLGFELGHPKIDFTPYRSSQSLLDYETVIWDPSLILSEYAVDSLRSPYQGRSLLEETDSALIKADLLRRKREMVDLLKLGGTIIIFLSRPHIVHIYTGEETHSGTGRNRHTTQIVKPLDLSIALPLPLNLVEAEGSKMEFRGSGAFGDMWRKHADDFVYRAYLEDAPGKPQVFIQRTGHPVASIVRAESGTLLLLPDLTFEWDEDGNHEIEISSALLDLADALKRNPQALSQPKWVKEFQVAGEKQAVEDLTKAEKSVSRALKKREDVRSKLNEIEQRKTLVTGTGAALESQVAKAFEALGCEVECDSNHRVDLLVRCGKRVAVVEVKGLTKSAKEANAAQLEKWVSEYYEQEGEVPKGILVVNAFNKARPWERPDPVFPAQMLPYAESRGHCLITGLQLLAVAQEALTAPGKAPEILDKIFQCVGTYDGPSDPREILEVEQHHEVATKQGSD